MASKYDYKKKWLRRYIDCKNDIDSMSRELEEWKSRAEKITQTLSDMPRGSNKLGFDDVIVAAGEIIDKIKVKTEEAKRIKIEIEIAIEELGDQRLVDVMKYRYINNLNWQQIAITMIYSEVHVKRCHGEALHLIKINNDTK